MQHGNGRVRSRTGMVYDERSTLHRNMEPDHVEAPLRTKFIAAQLEDTGVMAKCERVAARPATDEELLLVHTPAHLQLVRDTKEGKLLSSALQDFDMYSCTDTEEAARVSCGGLVELTKKVVSGELANGFAVVRPPGHHSDPSIPSGFCMYSNVAIAAKVAQKEMGAKKVLIFDWDVHHGNGTEWVFYNDPSVVVISVHGHGLGKTHAMRPGLIRRLREEDTEVHGKFVASEQAKQYRRDVRAAKKRKRPDTSGTSDDEAMDFFNGLGYCGSASDEEGEEGDELSLETLTHSPTETSSSSDFVIEPKKKKKKKEHHACNEVSSQTFYPGTGFAERTGVGKGVGANINVPWPCDGFGDLEYLRVVDEIVVPVGKEFDPDLVIVSAGFDCALGDKLGTMKVTQSGFAAMTRSLSALSGGKVCVWQHAACDFLFSQMVMCLEGGYNTEVIAVSAEVCTFPLSNMQKHKRQHPFIVNTTFPQSVVRELLRLSGEDDEAKESLCLQDQVCYAVWEVFALAQILCALLPFLYQM